MRHHGLLRALLGAGAVLTAGVLLAGCGDSAKGGAAPGASASQTLDTAQILSIAQVPTENTDPLPVDGGALIVADADDETSDPMPIG